MALFCSVAPQPPYYYKARFYSPTLGRFLQPDPAGFAGNGLNLYNYVGGDPVNFTDSFGYFDIGPGPFLPTYGPGIDEPFAPFFIPIQWPFLSWFAGFPSFFGSQFFGFPFFNFQFQPAAAAAGSSAATITRIPPPPPVLPPSVPVAYAVGLGVSAKLGQETGEALVRIWRNAQVLFSPDSATSGEKRHGNDALNTDRYYLYLIRSQAGSVSPLGPLGLSGVWKYGIAGWDRTHSRLRSQVADLQQNSDAGYYGVVLVDDIGGNMQARILEKAMVGEHFLKFGAIPLGNTLSEDTGWYYFRGGAVK